MNVFVVDTNKHPLSPVHPARARKLLAAGKVAVYRTYPFTLILKKAIDHPTVAELRVKLDPGSKTTGIAIVNDHSGAVVFAAELAHRGHQIKERLLSRRAIRRSRRQRKTRYRKARGLAATITGEPHRQCANLGAQTEEILPYHRD